MGILENLDKDLTCKVEQIADQRAIQKLNVILNSLKIKFPKPYLDYVYCPITLECNRNCKSCVTCSPLCGPETRITLEAFESNLKRLLNIIDINYLEIFDIGGGEPLCHPDCIEFFKIARKYLPIQKLNLRSNGLLLKPWLEEHVEILNKIGNIQIEYTHYPNTTITEDEIRSYSVDGNIKPLKHSHNPMFYHVKFSELKSSYKMSDTYILCHDAYACNLLRIIDEKTAYFTPCPGACFLDIVDKNFGTNLESRLTKKDKIDIWDDSVTAEDFCKFIGPIPFCGYCRRNEQELFQPELSKKSRDEWIADEKIEDSTTKIPSRDNPYIDPSFWKKFEE